MCDSEDEGGWWSRHLAESREETPGSPTVRERISGLYAGMCAYCGRTFPSAGVLAQHARLHYTREPGAGLRCADCGVLYTPDRDLYTHVLRVHAGHAFRCLVPSCRRRFSDKTCLIDHHYLRHGYQGPPAAPQDVPPGLERAYWSPEMQPVVCLEKRPLPTRVITKPQRTDISQSEQPTQNNRIKYKPVLFTGKENVCRRLQQITSKRSSSSGGVGLTSRGSTYNVFMKKEFVASLPRISDPLPGLHLGEEPITILPRDNRLIDSSESLHRLVDKLSKPNA